MKLNFNKVLTQLEFKEYNAFQKKVIKEVNQSNLRLIAPTGSGKTVAFLLYALSKVKVDFKSSQVLILAPSRELVIQIHSVLKRLKMDVTVSMCYGGHKMSIEKNELNQDPQIIIGTPGRVLDHISKGTMDLDRVHTVVVDEYDKCLDMGFEDEMTKIIEPINGLRNRMLTSATRDVSLPKFMRQVDFVEIDFSVKKKTTNLKLVTVPNEEKMEVLGELLSQGGSEEKVMVFANHRDTVERIYDFLEERGFSVAFYHGGLEQSERELALIKFRNGSVNVLVSSNLGARGLDIPEVSKVIHYQQAPIEEDFIHRNGRTNRQTEYGEIYLFCGVGEAVKDYVDGRVEAVEIEELRQIPIPTTVETLFVGKGKKDKVNKIDILGFLTKVGGLSGKEVGRIDVLDKMAFVAVPSDKVNKTLKAVRGKKIKGKSVILKRAR